MGELFKNSHYNFKIKFSFFLVINRNSEKEYKKKIITNFFLNLYDFGYGDTSID